jgi:hypothetical protein
MENNIKPFRSNVCKHSSITKLHEDVSNNLFGDEATAIESFDGSQIQKLGISQVLKSMR